MLVVHTTLNGTFSITYLPIYIYCRSLISREIKFSDISEKECNPNFKPSINVFLLLLISFDIDCSIIQLN